MTRNADFPPLPQNPDLHMEIELWSAGFDSVGGIDEAGRGAWAGPVAAAVVVLPQNPNLLQMLSGVRDSKLMSPCQRARWAESIKQHAAHWAVGFTSVEEIDRMGILPATRLACQRALEQLPHPPQHLLLDFLRLPAILLPQKSIAKGDRISLSIAAASVLAKVSRDALMQQLDSTYPGYGFARHKGYGTSMHQKALQQFGACAIHRRSFSPVKANLFS